MPRYKLSPEERAAEKELNGNVNKSAVGDNPSFCVNLKLGSKMIILSKCFLWAESRISAFSP